MNSQAIGATEVTQQNLLSDLDILQMLKKLLMQGQPTATRDQQGRQRVIVDNSVNVNGSMTVSSVTAQSGLLGWDQHQIAMQSRIQFADCIRSKLS